MSTPGGAVSRTRRRPSRSSELTGSSNQVDAALRRTRSAKCERLLAGVRAVGVDEQRRRRHRSRARADAHPVRDRAPARGRPSSSPRASRAPPSLPSCSTSCSVAEAGEAAAAVGRDRARGSARAASASGDAEHPRLEIPQRDVDGGDRRARDAGASEVPDCVSMANHVDPFASTSVPSHDLGEYVSRTTEAAADAGVCVADPGLRPPRRSSTTTIVVASHSSVPSLCGCGVGTVYAPTSIRSIRSVRRAAGHSSSPRRCSLAKMRDATAPGAVS